jgi:hypothetical protein
MCSITIIRAALTAVGLLFLPGMVGVVSAAAPTDACMLLSQAQVAMALGVEVDAGRHIIGAGDCRWTQPGKPGADVALLQVNLSKPQSFETGRTPISGWTKTSVSGIGDDAYAADSGKITFPTSPSLSVKKGSVYFAVAAKVPKASLAQIQAIEKTVASRILEKL